LPAKTIPDDELIRLFRTIGATKAAKETGLTERAIYKRVAHMRANGNAISAPTKAPAKEYPHRQQLAIREGVVIVGSDFHIWPGPESTCLRAFKKFIDDMRPAAVILNGDVLDFPQISRHPPIGWDSHPTVKDEIEAAQDHLHDIAKAARRAHKLWLLGNHDARYETRLATVASEYKGLPGISLGDAFPLWGKGWSCFINDDVVVKHRFPKGGQHATSSNPLWSGRTTVQGHLHNQQVRGITDYNGTRWGVDLGCVADTDHRAFVGYTEDSYLNWRSGFAVLTFKDGELLPPELVTKWRDDVVTFRGQLMRC
jgi:hypothetical protein